MKRAALVAFLLVAALAVLLVARRGGDDSPSQFENACAASGVEVPVPTQIPSSFPLPPGTRFTLASVSAAGAVLASGYVPLSFPEAVQFFRARPAAAGYRALGVSESEGAGRVAANFRGHGRSGSWHVDELSGCSTASLLTLRFKP